MNIAVPKVSVVMSIYSIDKYGSQAIDSILSQSFTNFEFIIINDSPSNKALGLINSYKDPRIIIINNKANIGLTKSLNKGLAIARGDYIARMDADDISVGERIEKQVDFMERNSNVGLLGSCVYFIDENGYEIGTSKVYNGKYSVHFMCHGSILMRKSCLDKVGYYREIFKYAQDYDLWLRLSEICDVVNMSEPLYKLRIHKDSISMERKREQDIFASLAIEMAVERERYGKDSLSAASPGEARAIRDQKLEITGQKLKKELSLNYCTWCNAAIILGDYRKAFGYAINSIIIYPPNFKAILTNIMQKAGGSVFKLK